MSMTQQPQPLKSDSLHQQLDQLLAFLDTALRKNDPLHTIERALWTRLLQLGHDLLANLFAQCGSGDLGETLALPDGRRIRDLLAGELQ